MTTTTLQIVFESNGQDFLSWCAVNGILVDCQPDQGKTLMGARIYGPLWDGNAPHINFRNRNDQERNHDVVKIAKLNNDQRRSSAIADRFLSLSDVAEILGVSKRTVERMEKRGILPAKTKLTHKTVGWRSSKFQEFMNTL